MGARSVLEEPSPKSHRHEVIAPWEVSLNWTRTGALPLETSRENEAIGGGTGVGVGVGVGLGRGVGVGLGVEVSDGVGVRVMVGESVGVGVGSDTNAGVRVGVRSSVSLQAARTTARLNQARMKPTIHLVRMAGC